MVSVPIEKIHHALALIKKMKSKRKTTLYDMQALTGFLNFLCKAIVPGRTFMRRLYSYMAGILKPHHHISITREIKSDLTMWEIFLKTPKAYARPFFRFQKELKASDIDLFTDAASTKRMWRPP